jgi:hypothetical protein
VPLLQGGFRGGKKVSPPEDTKSSGSRPQDDVPEIRLDNCIMYNLSYILSKFGGNRPVRIWKSMQTKYAKMTITQNLNFLKSWPGTRVGLHSQNKQKFQAI